MLIAPPQAMSLRPGAGGGGARGGLSAVGGLTNKPRDKCLGNVVASNAGNVGDVEAGNALEVFGPYPVKYVFYGPFFFLSI